MSQHPTRNPLLAIGRRNALLVALGVPLTFGQCQADQGPRPSAPPPPSSRLDSQEEGADEEDGPAVRP